VNLPAKIVAIHRALDAADIPHAFGGALALAWCTERARGTIDIDLNVFVGRACADAVKDALARDVTFTASQRRALARDGQVRVWWDETPIDVFLDTTPFHEELPLRTHREPFAGDELPFLSCRDLAVFKAFFNRTRDWADLEDMWEAGTLERDRVLGVLVELLGTDDERVTRLRELG